MFGNKIIGKLYGRYAVQKCMKNMKIYYLDCVYNYNKTSTSTENKNNQTNRRLMDKILQTENLTDVAR